MHNTFAEMQQRHWIIYNAALVLPQPFTARELLAEIKKAPMFAHVLAQSTSARTKFMGRLKFYLTAPCYTCDNHRQHKRYRVIPLAENVPLPQPHTKTAEAEP